MEICYKRNLNQSYMFITSDPAYSGYQIHMCRQNHIHNLLQFEPVVSEGETQFRYEITGKRSLDHVLESSDFAIEMFAKNVRNFTGNLSGNPAISFGGRGDSIRPGEYLS